MSKAPLRVLYVEDDAGLARLMQRRLERDGCQVDLALSGEQALQLLQTRIYDLLALDYLLPGINGCQVLSRLAEIRRSQDLSFPPSIMITGAGDEQTAVEALKLGASDYIVKDLEGGYLELMPAAIRQVLEKQRLVQEKQQAEYALRESEARYRALFDQVVEGFALLQPVYGVDLAPLDFLFLEVNPAFENLSGAPALRVVGSTLRQLLPLSSQTWMEHLQPVLSGGEPAAFECHASEFNRYLHITLYRPVTGQCAALLEDITERHQSEERLLYLSTHDALTGLYNRAFFETELARLDYGRQFPVTLLMIDIDGLKAANDHYGHAAGDYVLIRMARLLHEAFRAEDITARIGGDEFAVLLPEMDEASARLSVQRLRRLLAEYSSRLAEPDEPGLAAWPGLALSASIGSATGDKNSPLAGLLRLADSRMYLEKSLKKSAAVQADAIDPAAPGGSPPFTGLPSDPYRELIPGPDYPLPSRAVLFKWSVRLLLHSSQDPAVLVDERGVILAANQLFAQQIKTPLNNLPGIELFPLLEQHSLAAGDELRRHSLAALQSAAPVRFELQQEQRWTEYTLHPVRLSPIQANQLAIYARDVTPYHLAVQHLQFSLDQVHTVLGAMQDAVLLLEPGGRIIYSNPAAGCMLGIDTPADFSAWLQSQAGLRLTSLAGEALDENHTPWRLALAGDPAPPDTLLGSRGLALSGLALSGLVIRARPLPAREGQEGAVLLLVMDHRRASQAESALQQVENRLARLQEHNQRMGDEIRLVQDQRASLLREVNHRVRTNLSILLGMLSLQQEQAQALDEATRSLAPEGALPPDLPACKRVIETLSLRIQSLAAVHSLLSASDWTPLLASELASNVLETALHNYPQRQRIQVVIHPSDARLTLDQAHNLALVLTELTINAVQHALGSRPRIRLEVKLDSSPDLVHIEFSDDGPGFPPAWIESFSRADRASLPSPVEALPAPGSGLELVRTLVERSLQGELQLKNTPGATLLIRFTARA